MPEPDWESEGLTEGLYGSAKEDRLDLLRELWRSGIPLEEIRQATAQSRLALLPVERVLGGEPRHNRLEVAEQAGLDPEVLMHTWEALGLPTPDEEEVAYTDEDIEAARRLRRFIDAGIDPDALVAMSRVLGLAMARYAEGVRSLIAESFLVPGDSEHELATRYAEVASMLRPLNGPLMEHVFTLHVRELVRGDMITRAERETGRFEGTDEGAVAFCDLVGFTSLGERVESEELGEVASRLNIHATRALEAPVRLVKTIGDAVMLVSPATAPLLRSVLTLVDLAEEDEILPALRAGVAHGPLVQRFGDWYGRPVNLASRVTARARPGSVLTTEAVREDCPDGFDWSRAGGHRLKGVSGRQVLWRVRHETPE